MIWGYSQHFLVPFHILVEIQGTGQWSEIHLPCLIFHNMCLYGDCLLKSHQSILLSVSFYATVSGQCDWAGGLEHVAASCEVRGFFSQHRGGGGVWLLVWVTNNCFSFAYSYQQF